MRRWLIVSGVVLLIGLIAGLSGLWIVFGPNTTSYDGDRSIKIPPGSTFSAVVDTLEAADILGSARTFEWVARATGWGNQVKAGHYSVESGISNYDLLSKLRRGLQSPIRITIPPGTRPEVMAALAGSVMYFDKEENLYKLRQWVRRGRHNYMYATGRVQAEYTNPDAITFEEFEGNTLSGSHTFIALVYYRETALGGYDSIIGIGAANVFGAIRR